MWIYIESEKKFKELDRNDRSIEFIGEYQSAVKYSKRKNSKKYEYCIFGETKREVGERANAPTLKNIAILESRLEALRATLVPYE
jgi:hypothetical protein